MPGWGRWASKRQRGYCLNHKRKSGEASYGTQEREGFQRLRDQWSHLILSSQTED